MATILETREKLNRLSAKLWPDLSLDFLQSVKQYRFLTAYLTLNYKFSVPIVIDYIDIAKCRDDGDVEKLLKYKAKEAIAEMIEKLKGYLNE